MNKPLEQIELLPDDGYSVACRGHGVSYFHHSVVDKLLKENQSLQAELTAHAEEAAGEDL